MKDKMEVFEIREIEKLIIKLNDPCREWEYYGYELCEREAQMCVIALKLLEKSMRMTHKLLKIEKDV